MNRTALPDELIDGVPFDAGYGLATIYDDPEFVADRYPVIGAVQQVCAHDHAAPLLFSICFANREIGEEFADRFRDCYAVAFSAVPRLATAEEEDGRRKQRFEATGTCGVCDHSVTARSLASIAHAKEQAATYLKRHFAEEHPDAELDEATPA